MVESLTFKAFEIFTSLCKQCKAFKRLNRKFEYSVLKWHFKKMNWGGQFADGRSVKCGSIQA